MNISTSYKSGAIFSFSLSITFLFGLYALLLNDGGVFAFSHANDNGTSRSRHAISGKFLGDLCSVEANGDDLTDYTSNDASAVQMAVNAAAPGDILKVAGTCTGIQNTNNMTQTLYLSQSLTIQGGYHASNWLAVPDLDLFPTLLSADSNGRIVFVPSNITATLSTLILMDGDIAVGAGIYVSNGATLTVSHGVLISNEGEDGSAIFNNGHLGVGDTTFVENNANTNGTIYNQNSVMIWNTTFSNNTAFRGGGIYNNETYTLTVTNSTFSNNSVEEGGGIHNRGTMMVTFSTFSGNSANFGSALQNWNGTMTLMNNIMAGNTGSSSQCLNEGILVASLNNLITSGNCVPTLTIDPLLSSLGDYGGSTETFNLLAYSPAIDLVPAGIDGCGTTTTTDQRGFVRPADDACDIGAVEVEFNFAPVAAADSYETSVNTTLVITDTGVLSNDVDGDGDTITAILNSDVGEGTLGLNGDGSFTYQPPLDWTGVTTFTYHIFDGETNSSPVVVTLTVNLTKGLTIYLPIIKR